MFRLVHQNLFLNKIGNGVLTPSSQSLEFRYPNFFFLNNVSISKAYFGPKILEDEI